jgi:hypothetical protein
LGEFISALGGASLAWPLAARAQQRPKVPLLGYLTGDSDSADLPRRKAFTEGLRTREQDWTHLQRKAEAFGWTSVVIDGHDPGRRRVRREVADVGNCGSLIGKRQKGSVDQHSEDRRRHDFGSE